MTVFTIKVFGLKKPAVVSSVVKINAEKLRSPSIEKRKDEGGRGIVPVKKEKKSFIDIFGLLCRTCYYCKLQFFIISYSVHITFSARYDSSLSAERINPCRIDFSFHLHVL